MIVVAFIPLSDSPRLMDWVVTLGGKSARGAKYPSWASQAKRDYYGTAGIYESTDMVGVQSDLGDVAVKVTIPSLINNSILPGDARIILARRNIAELSAAQYSNRAFTGAYSVADMLQYNTRWFTAFDSWVGTRELFIADFPNGNEAAARASLVQFILNPRGQNAVAGNNLR